VFQARNPDQRVNRAIQGQPPYAGLQKARRRGPEKFQVRLRRSVWKTIIEVAVDGLEDFRFEGIVNGGTPFPIPTVLGDPGQSFIVERAFEKSRLYRLKQLNQRPFETVWRKMLPDENDIHFLLGCTPFLAFPPVNIVFATSLTRPCFRSEPVQRADQRNFAWSRWHIANSYLRMDLPFLLESSSLIDPRWMDRVFSGLLW
jgi:hypothetical protein